MSAHAELVSGPLGPRVPPASGGAGAVVCFEGVVRPLEDGSPLAGLEYEAYEPMTSRELRSLGEEIARRHGLLGLWVQHSVGHVAAGETSFRLQVTSRHRAEAIRAISEFVDRMKQEVPLWKVPVRSDERRERQS